MFVRLCLFILGLLIFIQANHWATHTQTSEFVVIVWGILGALISLWGLTGVRPRWL